MSLTDTRDWKSPASQTEPHPDDDNRRRERNVLRAFWGTLTAVSVTLFVFSLGAGDGTAPFRQFALALLVAAAAACVGALLGFLFGLPRSGDELRATKLPANGDDAGANPVDGQGGGEGTATRRPARANNNLLEISDWLTKIIVGAGLVGLKDLRGWISRVAQTVGEGAGLEGASQTVFGGAVLTFFFGWGFLFLYIQTRTIISVIFVATERALEEVLSRKIRAAAGQVQEAVVGQVRDQVRDAVEVEVREHVVPQLAKASVGTILQLLYTAPREAEKMAREFLKDDARNGLVWLYLACALGQQHAEPAASRDRVSLRDDALRAVTQALRHDPALQGLARGFMYEDDENHLSGDNDLASFREDPEFQEIIGPPPPKSR